MAVRVDFLDPKLNRGWTWTTSLLKGTEPFSDKVADSQAYEKKKQMPQDGRPSRASRWTEQTQLT
jgi:hypothetical protein